jgi:hypothetical protein
MTPDQVAETIDRSPYNRGLSGSDWVSNPANVAITYPDSGVVLFEHDGHGSYEAHVLLESRGRTAINQGKAAIHKIFTEHRAVTVYGLTPVDNRAARMYARLVGFRSYGIIDTEHGSCELFQIVKGENP